MLMNRHSQIPPALLARAIGLCLGGRVHFPKDGIGRSIEDGEEFVEFRKVLVDPQEDQPAEPKALFRVRFRFARFSPAVNKLLSLIPIPFIIAQPGFRSKTWLSGKETGTFQGIYEWDTVEDAQRYWDSFPMNLMKRRAIPETLHYEILDVHTSHELRGRDPS